MFRLGKFLRLFKTEEESFLINATTTTTPTTATKLVR